MYRVECAIKNPMREILENRPASTCSESQGSIAESLAESDWLTKIKSIAQATKSHKDPIQVNTYCVLFYVVISAEDMSLYSSI